jgi:hypothetical protein
MGILLLNKIKMSTKGTDDHSIVEFSCPNSMRYPHGFEMIGCMLPVLD